MNVTKLLPTVALSLSLVLFTSCKIENLASDLEPYYKEITGGSDSSTYLTALSSAASTSTSTDTYDFQEGFKAGYAAGYAEAARMNQVAKSVTPAPAPAPAPVSTPDPTPASQSSTITASLSPSDISVLGLHLRRCLHSGTGDKAGDKTVSFQKILFEFFEV